MLAQQVLRDVHLLAAVAAEATATQSLVETVEAEVEHRGLQVLQLHPTEQQTLAAAVAVQVSAVLVQDH